MHNTNCLPPVKKDRSIRELLLGICKLELNNKLLIVILPSKTAIGISYIKADLLLHKQKEY